MRQAIVPFSKCKPTLSEARRSKTHVYMCINTYKPDKGNVCQSSGEPSDPVSRMETDRN